ncbi:PREDICTED: altered inheritance of mitochondria protein 3-2-like isoform X2 [Vollenhovia emeryi]|uniref:altered inheritance of mitochondria protein 3-2-like isoform X2 n=1 Tax=Vollenhovia emeryi TaxID=411798 RepID=UPI0005F4C9F6|nr:PREDICTED: altered inheritance of mitochondria protein 3-2-like isoform X2 [Vollenhovia emeryi]
MLITMSEFKFSAKNEIYKDGAVELLQNFDESEGTLNSSDVDSLSGQQPLLDCDICGERFTSKKPLRVHINTHLRKLRIVLRRVASPKVVKVRRDTYWLDPERTGSLKLTLKKQCAPDSLKLTLKKSSQSEDFTVVNNNFYPVVKYYQQGDVAGAKENDPRGDKAAENTINEPFENVMVDQQDDYDSVKLDTDHHNPLEENERPSADINESDSDVGSDMANPSEKDDQNAEDTQSTDNFDASEKRLSESEDHEETDALEATCRETIENLKKLGEQSSSRSAGQLIDSTSVEEEDDRSHESSMIHNLEQNPAISINPKSFTFSNHTAERAPVCDNEDKNRESADTSQTQGFNWNQLSADLSSKNNEDFNKEDSEQQGDSDANMDSAGSILQSFLIEHQRRNPNEVSLSNSMSNDTAEYVPLEKLAETVNTCRVCNEKFKDIAHLDEHRSKAGHYQCNIPECVHLIFHSTMEVSIHRAQVHGTPLSPSVSQLSPHHLSSNANTPHLGQTTHSPHAVSVAPVEVSSTNGSHQLSRTSPLTSPHQTNSPTFNAAVAAAATVGATGQQMQIPPVNFEQLPPPVQQLAQQVQRMPLPQTQMPPSLPPGANTMIPAPNYFVQPPGRPPLYRIPGPQGIHYQPHMAHLYQYGPGPYPQLAAPPPQMHPQLPQQVPRGRYPASVVQNSRAPRLPQTAGPVPRQRMKRPLQQTVQQNNTSVKQRRMDVLLPDRNEDADCHVIAQQKRNDGLPVIQNVQGATTQQTSRNDSTIHLTDSITLSVRQPAQVQNTSNPGGKKSDAKAVANVLAARGITVTPAANKNKTSEQNKQIPPQQLQRLPPSQPPLNVTALNLNSAISIIPTSSQRKQQEQGQFAVPQNKQNKSPINDQVERPPRPPTVDLTQDTPPQMPVVRRGRPPRALLTCQVCDKNFQNQDMLTQHMATHRTTSKLLHRCNLCPAQYPTVQALTTHKQAYHKEVDTVAQNGGTELALPVVDLKSPHVLNRLANLGIQSYIPLSQLSAQTGGYFGLPIITIDGARNTSTCNLGALGATSILSLGPLKHISNG